MPYPNNLMILEESEASRLGGIDAARASNGQLKVRRLYSADKTDFTVVHMLTRAERDQLMAFYAANITAGFDFVWPGDGATYSVRFTAPPQIWRKGLYYRATVRLGEA
jgi:hypothetical protein